METKFKVYFSGEVDSFWKVRDFILDNMIEGEVMEASRIVHTNRPDEWRTLADNAGITVNFVYQRGLKKYDWLPA